jgi:uncharacterized protein (UPF0212 family)
MTDYLVTMESAWVVRDVRSLDDAIGIAIAEAGKRLNPAAKYVEVEAGMSACPYCEESLNCALVVANTALVGLALEMKVFRAESEEHAQRIAKSVVGKALGDVPLQIVETKQLAERKGAEPAAPARSAAPPRSPAGARPAGTARPTGHVHPFGRRPPKR